MLRREQGPGLESQMKALSKKNEPTPPERSISAPVSKGRRIHEDLEAQMAEGSKVRVCLGPFSVPNYNGVIYIQKAESSKERGEAEWIDARERDGREGKGWRWWHGGDLRHGYRAHEQGRPA